MTFRHIRNTHPLIQLEDIEKVFVTDEVETHVLSGVRLEIRHGDYVVSIKYCASERNVVWAA